MTKRRLGRPMVGRDVVPRAALLVEPEPPLALLPEVVLPPHADDRAHPREAVEHHRDERSVAPFVTTCVGPRTAADGFTGITWLTTSQSPSMRIAARCCLTVGADPGWVRI